MVRTTAERGGYQADVYFDFSTEPPIFHYRISHEVSAQILAWGQEPTALGAWREALFVIYELLVAEEEGVARAATALRTACFPGPNAQEPGSLFRSQQRRLKA